MIGDSQVEVDRTPILPAHIESTVQAIALLHAQHHGEATAFQRIIERATARAGQPGTIGLLTILIVSWIAFNLILMAGGQRPVDEPPFSWLQGIVGLAALYMTVLILVTQRRDDLLASHREQLTLELAIISEQKTAKIIQLLEELRRDDPHIRHRPDAEAVAMSTPADPQAVLDAIKTTQGDAIVTETAIQTEPCR